MTMDDIDDEVDEAVQATHPGFTVICQACQSRRVIVTSDVGFSALSGSWGGVHLKCQSCGVKVEIWEA